MRKDFITREVAEERIFETHGNNIKLLHYESSNKKANFLCNICGNIWFAIASSVWRGNGCMKCRDKKSSEKNRLPINNVVDYITKNNCEYISGEYINKKSKLEIKFECGHVYHMSFGDFKSGNRCYECGRKRSNLSKRVPLNKVMEIMISKHFTFISFPDEYINGKSLVEFKCEFDHYNSYQVKEFLKSNNCRECTKIRQRINQTGRNGSNWQGGLTELKSFLSKYTKDWKKESMKQCDYKCVISGQRFQDIHHLQSFNLILKESLNELGIDFRNLIGEYSENELFLLSKKINEIHYRYPLGVCLTKKWHNKFHQEYGMGDNTPEQFYEFQKKYCQI